ncbi:MAG: hypothetical protein RLZZ426_1293 [Actinomycetota bacterium]|jgi:hypothetical protein
MWRRNEEPIDEPDDSLVEWYEDPTPNDSRVLVHGISGFLDAGNAVKLAVDHILETTSHRLLASLDIDLLFDYRGRRPRMSYKSDHFEDIDLPVLQLFECSDERGASFLLLHGVEPDMGWMTVVDTIVELIEDLDVTLTVGIQAVPFPAPHTRPVAVTAHATDPILIEGRRPWVGDMEIPGSLSGYLELQLGRDGHRAVGFAAHVPHYLANINHPRSALTLLSEISATTGIIIPLDEIRVLADAADRELNEQIAMNDENQTVVSSLEQSFDAQVAERGGIENIDAPDGEEIAAQVEKFLAEMDARGRENE